MREKKQSTNLAPPQTAHAVAGFRRHLLAHYRSHGRSLPWRERTDAYGIWLSEIMLQQTTVATVIPYYQKFLKAFPTVFDLAAAPLDDVLTLWQGLGYYSRGRNLHKCAQVIVREHNGQFPQTAKELEKLPGIGPYTSAAIAAMAFGEAATVVDGNVLRICSRLFCDSSPIPSDKASLTIHAQTLTDPDSAGDYANAIMDLGATICKPNPKCDVCPVSRYCLAYQRGVVADYPKKTPKKQRPHKTGEAYVLFDKDGRVYLRRRPDTGLLAKLWEVPHKHWEERPLHPKEQSYIDQTTLTHCGEIKHVFTHFSLTLQVKCGQLDEVKESWVEAADIQNHALPTLMKKVLAKAESS